MSKLLADVRALVDSGEEADQILRAVVARIVAEPAVVHAAIAFVEPDGLTVGPSAGMRVGGAESRTPILFGRDEVAELVLEGPPLAPGDAVELARLVGPYCLVGWDTGGEDWDAG